MHPKVLRCCTPDITYIFTISGEVIPPIADQAYININMLLYIQISGQHL